MSILTLPKVVSRVGIMLFSIWERATFERMQFNRMQKGEKKDKKEEINQGDIRQSFQDKGWRVTK